MAITPLDIRKMTFSQRLRGYEQQEVENFLDIVAEELTVRLSEADRLERENHGLRRRLEEAHGRQEKLQETMLQAQRLSAEITENARKEAALLVKEAEVAADCMVSQAIEQANRIESKIVQLRSQRRQMQGRFKSALDHFAQLLEDDVEDERTTAMIRTLPRQRQQAS
jgi:cell division initiation protein